MGGGSETERASASGWCGQSAGGTEQHRHAQSAAAASADASSLAADEARDSESEPSSAADAAADAHAPGGS